MTIGLKTTISYKGYISWTMMAHYFHVIYVVNNETCYTPIAVQTNNFLTRLRRIISDECLTSFVMTMEHNACNTHIVVLFDLNIAMCIHFHTTTKYKLHHSFFLLYLNMILLF